MTAKAKIAPSAETDETAVESLWVELTRPIPNKVDELEPARPPDPGLSAVDMMFGQWPGDEIEEELLSALKTLK